MENKIKFGIVFLFCFALLSVYVSATVGVTSYYYDENPLYMAAGEVKEIAFILQNNGEGEDAIVKVVPNQNMEIAEFTDDELEYEVPLGSSGILVPVRIEVPSNAQIDDEWMIGAAFEISYDRDEEGALQISTTYMKDFKVIVGEKPAPSNEEVETDTFSLLSLVYLIIILIIIVFAVKILSKKKK